MILQSLQRNYILRGPENMRIDKWNFVSLGLPVNAVSSADHSDSHLVIPRIQSKKKIFGDTKSQKHIRYKIKDKGVSRYAIKAYGGAGYISGLS
jgi:hypothetical protein